MAITKVGTYRNPPGDITDYTAIENHLGAFINQVNTQAFILSDPLGTTEPVIKAGCYINHGGILYIADADTAIGGTPADGNVYIKLSVDGSYLVASYVNDISSFVYNNQYGELLDGMDMILPYLLVKSGSSWEKYRNDVTVQYRTNQNLRTTDNVSFSSVTTTYGPNKPIDNQYDAMPDVGIGGFTFEQDIKTTIGQTPTVTLPNGGYWIVVASSFSGGTYRTVVYRASGGGVVYGHGPVIEGSNATLSVVAFRIA